jgi:hypothetical protein
LNFDKFVSENPILDFSFYSHTQLKIVQELSDEILKSLDSAFSEDIIDASEINVAYGKFWLWVLGAYEIVRTISQTEKCFTESIYESISEIKSPLSKIRMPFAKQEYPGKRKPIATEASISNWSLEKKDIGFNIKSTKVWVRTLILDFNKIFDNLEKGDVLKDHRESY